MVLAETAAPANTRFFPLEYLSLCNFKTKLHHFDYRIPDVARWREQLSPLLWNPSHHHPQPWLTALQLLLPAGLFPFWFPHEHFHPKYILHFYWSSPDMWPFISWPWIHMRSSAGRAGWGGFPCHTFHASLPTFQVTSHPHPMFHNFSILSRLCPAHHAAASDPPCHSPAATALQWASLGFPSGKYLSFTWWPLLPSNPKYVWPHWHPQWGWSTLGMFSHWGMVPTPTKIHRDFVKLLVGALHLEAVGRGSQRARGNAQEPQLFPQWEWTLPGFSLALSQL